MAGTPSDCEDDAERRGRHSHAERGNEFPSGGDVSNAKRGVGDGILTRGVGTSFLRAGGVSKTTRGVGEVSAHFVGMGHRVGSAGGGLTDS
jgi:hypothetical protein